MYKKNYYLHIHHHDRAQINKNCLFVSRSFDPEPNVRADTLRGADRRNCVLNRVMKVRIKCIFTRRLKIIK